MQIISDYHEHSAMVPGWRSVVESPRSGVFVVAESVRSVGVIIARVSLRVSVSNTSQHHDTGTRGEDDMSKRNGK